MALHPNPVPQRQGWFPVSLCLSDPTRALLFASAGPCPMAAAPGVSAQGPWKRQGGTESQDGEGPSLRPARPGQQLPPSIPRDSSTGSGRRRKLPPSCPSRRGDGRAVAESAAEGPRALRALALPGRRSGLKARVLRKPHNAPRPRPRTGGGGGGARLSERIPLSRQRSTNDDVGNASGESRRRTDSLLEGYYTNPLSS